MSDATITTIVSGIITITTTVIGFLTIWIKLSYEARKATAAATAAAVTAASVEDKLDNNTQITKVGVAQATVAATNADYAKEIASNVNRKLNGGIDSAIAEAIKPLEAAIAEHRKNMTDLTDYAHKRNHDILTALQNQANQIGAIILLIKKAQ